MTAKQTFADRLRACMERMNYKQRYVADQVGVSQPAVAKWLAGDTRKVQADVLFRLADLFNVNARWLSDGQGQPWVSPADDWIHEMTAPAAQPAHLESAAETRPDPEPEAPKKSPGRPRNPDYTMPLDLEMPEEKSSAKDEPAAESGKSEKKKKDPCASRCHLYASVPTFSLIRGKSPRIPVLVPSDERIDAVIPKTDLKGHDPKACRQFVVRTDTMAPAICPEDTIVVDTGNPNRVHYGAVHLLFWQGQSTLGRLLKEPDGSVIIQFDNPAYPVRTFSESDFSSLITVIGPVVLRTGSKFMARGLLV